MQRPRIGRLAALVAASAVAAAAAGGIAYATGEHDSPEVIHGCSATVSGVLRIVDADTPCRPHETPLSWNTTGPVGPPGPRVWQARPGLGAIPGRPGLREKASARTRRCSQVRPSSACLPGSTPES